MKTLVVGGTFNNENGKESSIAKKIANKLPGSVLKNGGNIDRLKKLSLKGYNLIIWMPDVPNDIEKIYPKKQRGSVLICSKVLREDNNLGEAVSRIFKMNANAVISIDINNSFFIFSLIDALGNLWKKSMDVEVLCTFIMKFYYWTKGSIRLPSIFKENLSYNGNIDLLNDFSDLVKIVADKVEKERGGRYFGNASTRCESLFPSTRKENVFFVSTRNIPKDRISGSDFILTDMGSDAVYFNDSLGRKPSIDTPIQLKVYSFFDDINYMIHGHAYIKDAPFTKHYYPCGDLREFEEIRNSLQEGNQVINLRNHGFLIVAKSLREIEHIIKKSEFEMRKIGEIV